MSRGNGYGSYRTTREADMAAHDACPPLLRHALQYAVAKWGSVPILKAWRNGVQEGDIIAVMVKSDRKTTAKTYGRTHPEAAIDR